MQATIEKSPVIVTEAAHLCNELAPLQILRGARLVSLFRRRDARRNALRRIEDEEISWIVESLSEAFKTDYSFRYDGKNLLTSDGHPIKDLLENGLRQAEIVAATHPYYASFVSQRAHAEYNNHLLQLQMARGEKPNTMIELSAMPEFKSSEEEQLLRQLGGYKVDRSMGIVRVSAWDAEAAKMTIYSYSVDNATAGLFNRFASLMGEENTDNLSPEELLARPLFLELSSASQAEIAGHVVDVCDTLLMEEHGGGIWRAGREDGLSPETYGFVRAQRDIIQKLLADIQAIDRKKGLTSAQQKAMLRTARLGAVALADSRMNGRVLSGSIDSQSAAASTWAASESKSYDGCGLVVEANAEIEVLRSYALFGMNLDPTKCVTCPHCNTVVDLPLEDYRIGVLHCVSCDTALDTKNNKTIKNYSRAKKAEKDTKQSKTPNKHTSAKKPEKYKKNSKKPRSKDRAKR